MNKLDATGLLCPLPLIKLQNQVNSMSCGDIIELVATDPGVMHDIPAWSRMFGHEIVSSACVDKLYRICLKVGA